MIKNFKKSVDKGEVLVYTKQADEVRDKTENEDERKLRAS